MKKNTKEIILEEALNLFSVKGYDAVSVSQIGNKIGITKGALYKHYQNKRDIFDSIIEKMENTDASWANEYGMPKGPYKERESEYQTASLEQLKKFSKRLYKYWTGDEFACNFRRMIAIEQYKNKEMKELYGKYISVGPLKYVEDLFTSWGIANPKQKAVDFYGPMFLLYSAYDSGVDPKELESILNNHFICFEL